MRKLFKPEHKLRTAVFAAALSFVLAAWAWAWLALRHATPPLITHFNNAGMVRLGSMRDLTRAAVTGLLVVIFNFFVALELDERDRFWGLFIAVVTLLFAVLLFMSFAAIIGAN